MAVNVKPPKKKTTHYRVRLAAVTHAPLLARHQRGGQSTPTSSYQFLLHQRRQKMKSAGSYGVTGPTRRSGGKASFSRPQPGED